MTVSKAQNSQVETAAKLALQGGAYQWSAVPISAATGGIPQAWESKKQRLDMLLLAEAQRASSGMLTKDGPEDSTFRIVDPLKFLVKEAKTAEARRNLLVAEKQVPTSAYRDVGPKSATATTMLAMLDRIAKKAKDRPKPDPAKSQVAGDRRAYTMDAARALDVESLLPAGAESIKQWFSWLARRLNQFTLGYQNIRRFLFYNPGKTLYRDLAPAKKAELRKIVEGIVARDEA